MRWRQRLCILRDLAELRQRATVYCRFYLSQHSEQFFVTEAASSKAALERILNFPDDALPETSRPRSSFGDELPLDSVGTCVVLDALAEQRSQLFGSAEECSGVIRVNCRWNAMPGCIPTKGKDE